MLSLLRTAAGLERHLYASEMAPFSQADRQPPLGLVCLTKQGRSGREECIGDHVGYFTPSWPVGGFSESLGSVKSQFSHSACKMLQQK